MKLALGSLIPLLAGLLGCVPPGSGPSDGDGGQADPGDAAASDRWDLGDLLTAPDQPDAGRDLSGWLVSPDAEAPRPETLWGQGVLDDVAQLAFNPEGVAPCHVQRSGTVQCKGENSEGQLGNGSFGGVNGAPVTEEAWGPVGGLSDVVSMVATPSARCALVRIGDVWCWGSSGSFHSATPVRVLGVDGQAVGVTSYRTVDGYDEILAVMRSGHVYVIDLWLASASFPPEASLLVEAASPGSAWAVDAGTGWYFVNAQGQLFLDPLFDDTRAAELDPFPYQGVSSLYVQNLSPLQGGAGLALLEDGLVACWGLCPVGDAFALGFVGWDDATLIPGLPPVRALLGPSCVVDASDGVWCWGQDIFQNQPGLFTQPTRAGYMPDVAALYYDGAGRPALGLSRAGALRKLVWP